MRLLLILSGTIAVILGCIGIVVPGLPTTPFILLASWCFLKGSPKMHKWLNKTFLKNYIQKYEREKGMTVKSKTITITVMWVMVLISSFLIIETLPLRITLLLLGLIGSVCVIFFVPKAKIR